MVGGIFKQVLNDVWKSTDGLNWKLVTINTGFEARAWFTLNCMEDKKEMVLVGGISNRDLVILNQKDRDGKLSDNEVDE